MSKPQNIGAIITALDHIGDGLHRIADAMELVIAKENPPPTSWEDDREDFARQEACLPNSNGDAPEDDEPFEDDFGS
jgi:hypothetical protein